MKSYGIQLYSVRDAMEKDVASTLKKIADMGYNRTFTFADNRIWVVH